MPSEKLFVSLLDRIEVLSTSEKLPVAINCLDGVGKTGSTAVSLEIRSKIREQIAAGIPPEEITINLPETIYAFRKQRRNVLANEQQLSQVASTLHTYVKAVGWASQK